jgi:16S rRNA (guanine966-N2)-methyltransferase
MRIIGGIYRGRVLETPQDDTVRPTSDKTRGAIFNILEHRAWPVHPLLPKSQVADVFCGTGALGLEALSRGVKHVTLIDNSRDALTITRANIRKFKAADAVTILEGNAVSMALKTPVFDLVFLDPPYGKGLIEKALQHFAAKGVLKENTVIVAETARDETLSLPPIFALQDERGYGQTMVRFFLYGKENKE